MNSERLTKVVLEPHVSEKSTLLGDSSNQVVFKVLPDATKREIKAAVERLFDVAVEDVRVLNVKGKRKAFGGVVGRRDNWKKAYVRLGEGQDIDFLGAE